MTLRLFDFSDVVKKPPASCFFLTPEMVASENKKIFEEEKNPKMKEALLAVNEHVINLLLQGKTLTKDTNGVIRLWEEGEEQ